MPLAMADLGREDTIVRVGGREETRKFLEKLGFVTGATVTVVASMGGNVIVNIKESRIAISREMAMKIFLMQG